MENRHQMKEDLQECIDSMKSRLHSLSRDIWNRPELAGQEANAHDSLVRFFSEQDRTWTVQSHYKVPTAFRASWGPVGAGERRGVNVGFLCEYDALPEIGHACGHNLIAEAGAAAAVGLKAAVESQPELPVPVEVTVPNWLVSLEGRGTIHRPEAQSPKNIISQIIGHYKQLRV